MAFTPGDHDKEFFEWSGQSSIQPKGKLGKEIRKISFSGGDVYAILINYVNEHYGVQIKASDLKIVGTQKSPVTGEHTISYMEATI